MAESVGFMWRARAAACGLGLLRAASKNSSDASFTLLGLCGSGVLGIPGGDTSRLLDVSAALPHEAGMPGVLDGLRSWLWSGRSARLLGLAYRCTPD